ncbi:MAG: hypothetical protein COB35_13290 [Gammaproteobacteria bacterium]|nr:MAG: hypothetical protein COB35_13290 [Gammaproteobacteria bacterium]
MLLCLIISSCANTLTIERTISHISVGAEQSTLYLPLLQGKRVGLIVNQTSRLTNAEGKNIHVVDHLLANNIDVKAIFAPEHGFRGDHDAGAKFSNHIDEKTGVTVISIYGKTRQPPAKIMAQLDVLIFDIQDVGVRYYTYISTMHYAMQAAQNAKVEFIVFDRPNPNIALVDGPMLELEFRSFVGYDQIPLVHGMTVGELAKMIKGEGWLAKTDQAQLQLTVIPVANYSRKSEYILPIKPSPNLPDQSAIYLYPQLGFFEATPVSVGRGTPYPFQVIGNDKVKLGSFEFMPVSTPGAALKPKLMNKKLYGQDFRGVSKQAFDLSVFFNTYQKFKNAGVEFINRPSFLDKLAGTDKFRKTLLAGKSFAEIKQGWQHDLIAFKKQRQPYLLYGTNTNK